MTFPDVSNRPLAELTSLAGKRIVVTGASQGIGAAMAKRMIEAGATLVIAARSRDKLDRLAAELGDNVHPMVADLSVVAEVQQLAERAIAQLGGLDIWVNNAGYLAAHDVFAIDEETWNSVYDLNVRGLFFGAQAAARHMKDHGGGVILNTASSLGFHAVPGQPHYVSSKWAVRGLTAALASDLGKHGIRVVAIAPGLTRSEGIAALEEKLNEAQGAGAMDRMAEGYPAKRLGAVDDIARVAAFLVSDAAQYMTGATILVDGGEVYGMPAAN